MAAYIALLRKDRDSDYGVNFPDFPGCVTAGRTLDDARRMAVEALQFHIEGMLQDGDAIPDGARTLDVVMADPEHRDAVPFLVDVPVAPARAVRINVTIPADILEAIDRTTTNRSQFLAQAARESLAHSGVISATPYRSRDAR
jgi:predicted RNase H-like HicB family nuclease